jgi:hypothetical protein
LITRQKGAPRWSARCAGTLLLDCDELYFNAGRLDRSVALASEDYLRLARPAHRPHRRHLTRLPWCSGMRQPQGRDAACMIQSRLSGSPAGRRGWRTRVVPPV